MMEQLTQRLYMAEQGGGTDRMIKQHEKGKLTARERLSLLLDPDSHFDELDALHSSSTDACNNDGVVVGTGRIWGRPVAVFAQDFTVRGGSLGAVHARKIVKIMQAAERMQCPIVGLNDSGGARIQEGVDALAGYIIDHFCAFVCAYVTD